MRTAFRLAVLAFANVVSFAAQAADIPGRLSGGNAVFADRAEQFVIYDYEPGVYMRAYWSQPWGARRYYPVTGKRPRVGRQENLNEVGNYQEAESYYREWSNERPIREIFAPRPMPPSSK